jgi:hypothetical protein
MAETGVAMMGTGFGTGESRARVAAEMAVSSPLLEDVNLAGATASWSTSPRASTCRSASSRRSATRSSSSRRRRDRGGGHRHRARARGRAARHGGGDRPRPAGGAQRCAPATARRPRRGAVPTCRWWAAAAGARPARRTMRSSTCRRRCVRGSGRSATACGTSRRRTRTSSTFRRSCGARPTDVEARPGRRPNLRGSSTGASSCAAGSARLRGYYRPLSYSGTRPNPGKARP